MDVIVCLYIILLSSAVLTVSLILMSVSSEINDKFFPGLLISLSFASFALSLCLINVPTAMDVYKNNTTLRITYQDSMAIDSVVVFK